MRRKVILSFLMAIAMLCVARDAQACVCVMSFIQYQPCSAYWRTDVVFTGVVSGVGPMTPVEGSGGKVFTMRDRVTRFTIEEAFRGVDGETVETFEHGTSCDYHFKQGERYFVYSSRDPKSGRIYVHSCSATKTFDRAEADLAYARGIVRGKLTPSIVGYVNRETRQSAGSYRSRLPLEGIRVVIEGSGKTVEVKTNARGGFEVFGLQAGKYRVRAVTPPELRRLYGEETIEVQVTAGRCGGGGFTVTSLSTIGGRVVDQKGKPIKTKVNLVLVDENNNELPQAEGTIETYTDAEGHYKFDWVAPGRYLIAVNARNQPGRFEPPFPRTYHPGVREADEAAVITIVDGQQYEAGELRLPPPLVERTIEGVVLMPDGRPAAHAGIILEFTDREWAEFESADAQGRFTLKVYEGYKYLVAGEVRREVQGVWCGWHSPPVEVISGATNEPLKLVITQTGFYRPRYVQQKQNRQQ